MRRIRLKKKRKISFLTLLLLIVLLFVISLIFVFKFIGDNLNKKVNSYAEKQARKIMIYVINQSVNKQIVNEFEEDIFKTEENTIDFNSKKINTILLKINSNLKNNLIDLENGKNNLDNEIILKDKTKLKKGIIYEIPTGIIFNNALLANIGPRIPVKLHLIGDVMTTIDTKVSNYGINNAIIEIYVKIVINEQVILPFDNNQIKVEEKIPIAIKLIQGQVPNYYSNNKDNPVVIDKNNS